MLDVYLATPYSHEDKAMEQLRYDLALEIVCWLMNTRKLKVLSPIVYSHNIALRGGGGSDWEAWKNFDEELIKFCREVWVANLDGWRTSKGIVAEVLCAQRIGTPVKYYDVKNDKLYDSADGVD